MQMQPAKSLVQGRCSASAVTREKAELRERIAIIDPSSLAGRSALLAMVCLDDSYGAPRVGEPGKEAAAVSNGIGGIRILPPSDSAFSRAFRGVGTWT